ncbi:hypothetical protein G9A89_007271 [Geosiphon pyriformis]|nr:hypothetical protein G9A89_007271 [Geosiphon pyriformis]
MNSTSIRTEILKKFSTLKSSNLNKNKKHLNFFYGREYILSRFYSYSSEGQTEKRRVLEEETDLDRNFYMERLNNFSNNYKIDNTQPGAIWTDEEVGILLAAVEKFGKKWQVISKQVFRSLRSAGALELRYKKAMLTKNNVTTITDSKIRKEQLDSIELDHSILSFQLRDELEAEQQLHMKNIADIFSRYFPDEDYPSSTKLKDVRDGSRKVKMCTWTPDEKLLFDNAIKKHGENWEMVSEFLSSKTAQQCETYWLEEVKSKDIDLKNNENSHPSNVELVEKKGTAGIFQ